MELQPDVIETFLWLLGHGLGVMVVFWFVFGFYYGYGWAQIKDAFNG